MNGTNDYSLNYTEYQLNISNGVFVQHTSVGTEKKQYDGDYYHLVYIAQQQGELRLGLRKLNVTVGDVILINPGVKNVFCSNENSTEMSMYSCAFTKGKVQSKITGLKSEFPMLTEFLDGRKPFIRIKDTSRKDIRNDMIKMIDDIKYSRPGIKYTINSLLDLLLISTFRLYTGVQRIENPFDKTTMIGTAINYIQKNIYTNISTNDIAGEMHLSIGYLCRIFKHNMGKSVTEYVNYLRVEKIKDELENTDRPIHLICEYFDLSPTYIARLFRKSTGYSFSEYKKKFNYKSNNALYGTENYENELKRECV